MEKENGIQSVNRAMRILSLFSNHSPRLGITEISRTLDLPKGTVHGLVSTLLKTGFLHQNQETRKYNLGPKIFELGVILGSTLEINQKAAGLAYRLVERTCLVSRVAIRDGDHVLITLNIAPRFNILLSHQIGPRVPLYCSAIGKGILAFLDHREINDYLDRTKRTSLTPHTMTQKKQLLKELEETRLRGYSTDREETILGIACIGVPIFERGGHLLASISLSGDPNKVLGKRMGQLVYELKKTAIEISRSLGYLQEVLEEGLSWKTIEQRSHNIEHGFQTSDKKN